MLELANASELDAYVSEFFYRKYLQPVQQAGLPVNGFPRNNSWSISSCHEIFKYQSSNPLTPQKFYHFPSVFTWWRSSRSGQLFWNQKVEPVLNYVIVVANCRVLFLSFYAITVWMVGTFTWKLSIFHFYSQEC